MNEVGTTTDVTGLTNVTTINENSYNSSGQRISKSEDDSTENYFYSGGALIYTKGSTGLMLTENILDLNGNIIASTRFDDEDESTSQTGWEGQYFFYHYDIRGSVTAIVDPDGNSVKEYAYDEFSNLSESGEATFDNEVTFTGSITDTSTGLQYMNARFYEPTTGRFITQDSYSGNAYDPWTQHLYAYCGNNPVNMIDPTGHSFADISARARLRLPTSAPTPAPTPSPEQANPNCLSSGFPDSSGYRPDGSKLANGIAVAAIGLLAVGAVIASGGAATPAAAAVLAATYTSGSAALTFGCYDIYEAFSGDNIIKDGIGEENYNDFEVLSTAGAVYGAQFINQNKHLFNAAPSAKGSGYNVIQNRSAEQVNKDLAKQGYTDAPYKPGTGVSTIQLTHKTSFVRFYSSNTTIKGQWIANPNDVAGLSAQEIQNMYALPFTPTHIADVTLLPGTYVNVGFANNLYGYNGMGIQYDLLGANVGSFTNGRPIQ